VRGTVECHIARWSTAPWPCGKQACSLSVAAIARRTPIDLRTLRLIPLRTPGCLSHDTVRPAVLGKWTTGSMFLLRLPFETRASEFRRPIFPRPLAEVVVYSPPHFVRPKRRVEHYAARQPTPACPQRTFIACAKVDLQRAFRRSTGECAPTPALPAAATLHAPDTESLIGSRMDDTFCGFVGVGTLVRAPGVVAEISSRDGVVHIGIPVLPWFRKIEAIRPGRISCPDELGTTKGPWGVAGVGPFKYAKFLLPRSLGVQPGTRRTLYCRLWPPNCPAYAGP